MAKKRINKEDIAPKGLFNNVTDGAKQAKVQIDLLKKSINALKSSAKSIKKDIGGAKVGDTKGMKDFDALQRKSNQTAKAKLGIDKQLLHHKAKLSQLQRDENKAIKTTIEAQSKLSKKQKQSLGTLQKLELSSRKLRAERAKLNLETKKGSQRLGEINRKLDQNNAKIRASGDAMKKQKMNVGNYGGAVGKLTGMLSKLGLGFGVFTALRSAFTTVKDFEQSQANLASVLGVNVDGMKALTEQSKELGATTTFTASQVAELQIEFAKLGFTQEQIEGMTESTLLLAEATGSDLGESATIVGATMRGFGYDVTETQRVVDVMANSFSKSSLDMSKFSTAMSAVAPVAKLAGLGIEETTALIGTLTDRGIEASTAGTGLRNMFLQSNKAGLTFTEALNKVRDSSDQTGEAMKLFGTRGATLGVILANNQEGVAELTQKLYASDGAAKQMAETQRNTLGGSIKLLTSAWEGWILKQNEAGGASDKLRGIIDFLSENIEEILGWVMFAIKQFLLFKGVMLASKLAMMGYNAVMMATKIAMSGFTKSMKKMDKGMKSTGIGLLVSLLIQLVYWIYEAVTAETSLEKAERERKETAEALKKAEEEEQAQFQDGISSFRAMIEILKQTNAGSKEREELIEKINKKYGTTIKNIKDEAKFMGALNVQVDAYIKLQKTRFLQAKNQKELTKQLTVQVDMEEKILKLRTEMMKTQVKKGGLQYGKNRTTDESFGEIRRRLSLDADTLDAWQKTLDKANKEIEKLGGQAVELTTTTFEAEGIVEEDPSPTGTPEKTISLIRATEDARLKIIKDAEKRETDIRQKSFDRLVEDTEAKKTNDVEFDAWKIAQQDLLTQDLLKIENKYADKREQVRQKSVLAQMQSGITEKEIELEKVADIFENFEETEALRKDIDKDNIALIEQKAKFDVENTKFSAGEKEKIVTDSEAKIEEIKRNALARTLAHEKQARDILKAQFTTAENEKLLELLKTDMSQQEITDAMLVYQIEQLEILIAEYKRLYPQLTDEITKMEIDLEQKKRQRDEVEVKETEDKAKEMAEMRQQAIQLFQDFYMKKADERIAKLDEEIEAHKKQADLFAQMAVEGNIEAKDSLAEENRLIAEAEAKKAEEEKRKQQIMMVTAVLSAYVANIDAGQDSNTALANAITSKAVLDQFIAGIGGFYEGTEDTGTVGNPLDSNGGRIAVLHNNERVLTAKQNKKIGGYSNEQVASIVEQNRLGKLAGNMQIGDSWESQLVVDQLMKVEGKLDEVNRTIQNKEVNSVELGAITQTAMKLVETRKKGLNRTISTYKVKV